MLSKIDNLILLEIYPASEAPIQNYSSHDLFKKIRNFNKKSVLVNGIDEAFVEFKKFNNEIVDVKQGKHIGLSCHPELLDETLIHEICFKGKK